MAADVVVPFTTLRVRDDHREPDDGAGRHRQPAVRPRHVHADGRHRADHVEPHAPALCQAGLTLSAAGVLAGTPTASGPFTFTVTATDANACTGSAPRTLSILSGPNQAPSFTAGANQTALEDGGPQAVAGWATAIGPGSADEAGQALTFNVTGNTNPALFSVAPAVSASRHADLHVRAPTPRACRPSRWCCRTTAARPAAASTRPRRRASRSP